MGCLYEREVFLLGIHSNLGSCYCIGHSLNLGQGKKYSRVPRCCSGSLSGIMESNHQDISLSPLLPILISVRDACLQFQINCIGCGFGVLRCFGSYPCGAK